MKTAYWPLIVTFTCMYACSNKLDDVERMSFNPKTPVESMVNFTLVHSDSGIARVSVYAAYSESYRDPEYKTYLRDSLRVNFYSPKGEIISTLSAKYGFINHTTQELLVEDSVRFYHYQKKQTLKTDRLIWTKKDSMIRTESPVFVHSEKAHFKGKGIEAKQDFSWYKILKPEGSIELEKEQEIN